MEKRIMPIIDENGDYPFGYDPIIIEDHNVTEEDFINALERLGVNL